MERKGVCLLPAWSASEVAQLKLKALRPTTPRSLPATSSSQLIPQPDQLDPVANYIQEPYNHIAISCLFLFLSPIEITSQTPVFNLISSHIQRRPLSLSPKKRHLRKPCQPSKAPLCLAGLSFAISQRSLPTSGTKTNISPTPITLPSS